MASDVLSLVNRTTGRVVVPRLQLATTFWRRFRGLQFRRPLAEGEGLLLAPCGSVHTHWMRFAISLVALDANGRVVGHWQRVVPWRFVTAPRGTHAMLETTAGSLPVALGDELAITRPPGTTELPSAARFLER